MPGPFKYQVSWGHTGNKYQASNRHWVRFWLRGMAIVHVYCTVDGLYCFHAPKLLVKLHVLWWYSRFVHPIHYLFSSCSVNFAPSPLTVLPIETLDIHVHVHVPYMYVTMLYSSLWESTIPCPRLSHFAECVYVQQSDLLITNTHHWRTLTRWVGRCWRRP